MSLRVIARLDIKGPNLVKGIHLEGLRVLGSPKHFAEVYYREGVDELFYMDAVASLYQRNSLVDFVRRTARDIFIPLTVGGGLRTLEDIRQVLTAGADKVSLNTAAVSRPEIIREAALRFGSSTIVVSIEAIRKADGSYEAFTDNGRERTGIDALEWAVRVAELGAGEILLTSIDREGTGKGFDVELTQKVSRAVFIPVVSCVGVGTLALLLNVVHEGAADAVCVASMVHYELLQRSGAEQREYSEGNVEFLKQARSFSKVTGVSVIEIKQFLRESGIGCRPPLQKPVHA